MKANSKFVNFEKDDGALIYELLIGAVFALIIGYTALNIGVYITGTIGSSLISSYPSKATQTVLQKNTIVQLENMSLDLGTNAKMVSTAYLITIITLPLIAVVMIKKLL